MALMDSSSTFRLMTVLSLSLLLASVIPKLTHNWVVGFQSLSIGKGGIRLCP